MPKATRSNDVLQGGGFWLHAYVGRAFKVGFVGQCFVVTAFCVAAVLIVSTVDRSLILQGRNVGLLEHPAIWAFFVLQAALPLSIGQSILKLQGTSLQNGEIAVHSGKTQDLIDSVRKFVRLQTSGSRLAATLIYCTGLAAFVWNTYQNQLPGVVVPYDFWDSTTYPWGFWLTRAYKFYLFVVLLPYIAMVHAAILVVILRLVRQSRLSGKLKLLPFHPDGVGGFGFIASLINAPIILTLIIGSIATAAAFIIHGAANVTPLIGLTILVAWAVAAYIVPILFLKTDIVALKRELIRKLRLRQRSEYSKTLEGSELEFRILRKENEALGYFDKLCTRVESISNYPHLKRLIRFVGLAVTPSLLAFAMKFFVEFVPVMGRLLRRP